MARFIKKGSLRQSVRVSSHRHTYGSDSWSCAQHICVDSAIYARMARRRLSDGSLARVLTSKRYGERGREIWFYGLPPDQYPEDSLIRFRMRGFFDDDDGVLVVPLDEEWRTRIASASTRRDGYTMVHIRRTGQMATASIWFGRIDEGEWILDVERWASVS